MLLSWLCRCNYSPAELYCKISCREVRMSCFKSAVQTDCQCVWCCKDEPVNRKKLSRRGRGWGWVDVFQNKHLTDWSLSYLNISQRQGFSGGWNDLTALVRPCWEKGSTETSHVHVHERTGELTFKGKKKIKTVFLRLSCIFGNMLILAFPPKDFQSAKEGEKGSCRSIVVYH